MSFRLNHKDPRFENAFSLWLEKEEQTVSKTGDTVAKIIAEVRKNGDEALFSLTQKFDRFDLNKENLAFSRKELDAARKACSKELLAAIEKAAERITAYHSRQRPLDEEYKDDCGVLLGHRWTAIEAVGIYVPGGTAAYPSSVLMNAVPAKVAGVPRIVMVVPTPDGKTNPTVLAAADIAGVTEIYRIGGAQAVAALAYGTKTIKPVSMIAGPGNAYVAEAKRQVFGKVGIDMIAGPSEILVVADKENNPTWIAADLLSQAEHDTAARAILITDDEDFADKVAHETLRQIKELPRHEIAAKSWQDGGAIIVVKDITQDAPALIDRIAPEHLELAVCDPHGLMQKIRNAGAIFLGRHTPEAIGDYVGGTNHVLPTAGSARFSSGLSVLNFMKRSEILGCDAKSLPLIGNYAVTLAQAEGLDAHANSVAIRLKG